MPVPDAGSPLCKGGSRELLCEDFESFDTQKWTFSSSDSATANNCRVVAGIGMNDSRGFSIVGPKATNRIFGCEFSRPLLPPARLTVGNYIVEYDASATFPTGSTGPAYMTMINARISSDPDPFLGAGFDRNVDSTGTNFLEWNVFRATSAAAGKTEFAVVSTGWHHFRLRASVDGTAGVTVDQRAEVALISQVVAIQPPRFTIGYLWDQTHGTSTSTINYSMPWLVTLDNLRAYYEP
jgi:hypothetical protein